MTSRLIVFALWCAALLIGSVYSTYHAYSFYSDDADRPSASGAGGGPRHK
ncbi:hypothetical protein [Novosphingobium aerophilum]|uniref:Uncharacterized protein n=1 Tax=Novosphingobium aerophilum TaxID=2839843 RepID=A0A7X1KAH0_9SPHN|nr:hypothetical protein [Novosphingobium aerophilum]MBC2650178.1 hypothetical protein [Novosphingobium aerophilum]